MLQAKGSMRSKVASKSNIPVSYARFVKGLLLTQLVKIQPTALMTGTAVGFTST